MPALTLQRGRSTDEGTPGDLSGTGLDCKTLELPWRDLNGDGLGDPRQSCITPGEYLCEWKESPKYGWCYEVTGVKGRSHILIHAANFAGDVDKGYQSQLLGCIALGVSHGLLTNKFGKPQKAVIQSKRAIDAFHKAMREQPFTLNVLAAPA
jgi:hypothetical protein